MAAGFQAWQKLGRSVNKGKKAIAIFAPMLFKKKDDGEGKLKRPGGDKRKSDRILGYLLKGRQNGKSVDQRQQISSWGA